MKFYLLLMGLMISISSQADMKPYLGVGLGGNSLQGINSEASKTGYNLGVKGILSFDLDQAVIDGALGYQNMVLNGGGVKITTRSVFTEVEARYKVGAWQVGGGVKLESGTDTTGQEFIGSSNQSNSVMLKAVYQTKVDKYPFRWELGVGSSVGTERSLSTVEVGIQIALPDSEKKEESRHWTPTNSAPVVKSVKPNYENSTEVADIKISLKAAKVLFGTDRFELGKDTEAKLAKLGRYLAKNLDNWERIKVSGHTDSTGDPVHNKALSQDRADSVLKVFVGAGVPEDKITGYGYGSNRPLDESNTPEAYSKNRRTEIEFFGVKDRAKLNQAITELFK